jgi:hypothetical protein
VGLDHLSFSVASRGDMEQAVRPFEEHGVAHGEITSLPSFRDRRTPIRGSRWCRAELTAPQVTGVAVSLAVHAAPLDDRQMPVARCQAAPLGTVIPPAPGLPAPILGRPAGSQQVRGCRARRQCPGG